MTTQGWRVMGLGAPFLFACSLLAAVDGTATPPRQMPTEAGTTIEVPSRAPNLTPDSGAVTEPEQIWIMRPGPGSRLVSPIQVQGQADATFENQLSLRLISREGEILTETSATIEAPLGKGGPFAGEVTFPVSENRPALLQVYSSSPRDGGTIHLSSVPVTLLAEGPEQIESPPGYAEAIRIEAPQAGDTLSGGSVTVTGHGRASFENNLVVELIGPGGESLAESAVTVAASDLGQPGGFEVQLRYGSSAGGPGRIVVWDPSPIFGGPVHLASVEVHLKP